MKPLFLLGTKPICKMAQSACCCARRVAVPCCGKRAAPDVASSFGCCLLKFCDCAPFKASGPTCCEPVAPLASDVTDAQFSRMPVRMSDLHLICHCLCCQQVAHIPETVYDAFGFEDHSFCCCVTSDLHGLSLPATASAYEMFLCLSGQVKCVTPQLRCKGGTRFFFGFTKYVFPPDKEVPCALVVCGKKLAGPAEIEDGDAFTFAKIAAPLNQDMAR